MEKFIHFLNKKKLSNNTIKTYCSSLKILQLENCTFVQLKKKIFNQKYAINTQWLHYNVALAYYKFYKNNSMINKLSFLKIPQIPTVYRKVFTKNFLYKKTEINEQDKNITKYYKILIRFLFETGMRAHELLNILEIKKTTLLIQGKGSKIREVFYKKTTLKQLLTINQGIIFDKTTKTLRMWIKKLIHKNATPHSMRRSFATHMLLKGANPKHVMIQMGHKKIETTFQYLNLSFELNKNIYNKYI